MKYTPSKFDQALAKELLGSTLEEAQGEENVFHANPAGLTFGMSDEPVMSLPRIGRPPMPIPNQFKWIVTGAVCQVGGYWEPDSWDEVQLGEANSLAGAIILAANKEAEMKIANVVQSISEAQFGEGDELGYID